MVSLNSPSQAWWTGRPVTTLSTPAWRDSAWRAMPPEIARATGDSGLGKLPDVLVSQNQNLKPCLIQYGVKPRKFIQDMAQTISLVSHQGNTFCCGLAVFCQYKVWALNLCVFDSLHHLGRILHSESNQGQSLVFDICGYLLFLIPRKFL